jgi:hypothetical protein
MACKAFAEGVQEGIPQRTRRAKPRSWAALLWLTVAHLLIILATPAVAQSTDRPGLTRSCGWRFDDSLEEWQYSCSPTGVITDWNHSAELSLANYTYTYGATQCLTPSDVMRKSTVVFCRNVTMITNAADAECATQAGANSDAPTSCR